MNGFGVWGLGFGVWRLGFGVWGLGFGLWGLGFRDFSSLSQLEGVQLDLPLSHKALESIPPKSSTPKS